MAFAADKILSFQQGIFCRVQGRPSQESISVGNTHA